MNAPAAWWGATGKLERFCSHWLYAELKRLRPGSPVLPNDVRPATLANLDLQTLAIDSLDLLQLAVGLAGALDLSAEAAATLVPAPRTFAEWIAACADAQPTRPARLRFRSSGSSGPAQVHAHAVSGLLEEAAGIAALLAGRRRVLSAVPAHHIYGFLCTVLLPAALDAVPVEDLDSPQALAAQWRSGDLVVGFPEFWQAIATRGVAPPADVVGLTSTAPCPAATVIALEALGLPLIELFGASETAGLGWRSDPDAPFRWFPWWQAAPGGGLRRRLPDGAELQVAPPDHIDALPPLPFRPLGRRDSVVQVGGVNVQPAAVGARLCSHPWVDAAAVRLMRPDEGERLKAFIVPCADAPAEDQLRPALLAWINAQLPPAERPVALRFGTALPQGVMGKAADWDV